MHLVNVVEFYVKKLTIFVNYATLENIYLLKIIWL